jgi:hypothetical protein
MVRNNRHDTVHLFRGLCPARGAGAAIIMPAVNRAAMNQHRKEIRTQVAIGAHAILVCGGAVWHQQGGRLRVPDNITLLPLPADVPELNGMEKRLAVSTSEQAEPPLWDSYQAIVLACQEAWHLLIHDPLRIASIGTRAWTCVSLYARAIGITLSLRGGEGDEASSRQCGTDWGLLRRCAPRDDEYVGHTRSIRHE